MIFEEIQSEIATWDTFVNRRFGLDAELLSVSSVDANRRVYRVRHRIVKIRKMGPELFVRTNDLGQEYQILLKLHGIAGVCQNPEYQHEEGWECLSYDCAPGQSLHNLLLAGALPRTADLMARLLKIIVSVNLRGICHRDIKAENIVVGDNGVVHLIDFDQAMELPIPTALSIDILGIGKPKRLGYFCLEDLLRTYWGDPPPRWVRPVLTGLRWLRRTSRSWKRYHPAVPDACGAADPQVLLLQEAWEIARKAGANSPGNGVAYYSLDVAGCHLDGERPWTLRWSGIFKKVDFEGKHVLECGCNLGLFSAFARRAGASRCVGVDVNGSILAGSRLVSEALGVENEFFQVDFDGDEPWEEKLAGFDLAIALSVAHWLRNRNRFFAFLGRHREVIFEGHDGTEMAIDRLREAGFSAIDVIAISERNRAVLHARK